MHVAGARHFRELIVWQLSEQLRVEVLGITTRPCFRKDFKLRAQLEDAIDSVCRNIAEGFGGTNQQFAWFLRISRRSLNEVQDELHSARLKGYVTDTDLITARRLVRRIYPAMASLLKHLDKKRPDEPDAE